MKRIFWVIIFIFFLSIVFLAISTFGWDFFEKSVFLFSENDIKVAESLKFHILELSNEIGERNIFKKGSLEKSAEYIAEQFESFGYNVGLQKYNAFGSEFKNIIVEKRGINNPEEIIIVGAHYDTSSTPGADDNASGVAGVIELSRFFSNEKIDRTIRFVAFANEEFFRTSQMGSWIYAKEIKKRNENIIAMISLEMIGYYSNDFNSQRYPLFLGPFYPNKGNFITIVSDFNSSWLGKDIQKLFKRHSEFPIKKLAAPSFITGVDWSDHWSFWEEGYPAIMITDTSFFRNKNYHELSDTWDTLDYKKMSKVIDGLRYSLLDFANKK